MPRSGRVKTATILFVVFAVIGAPMSSYAGTLSDSLAGLLKPGSPTPAPGGPVQATAEPSPSGTVTSDMFRIGWYDNLYHTSSPAQIAADGMSMITAYHGDNAQPAPYLEAAQAAGTTVMLEIPEALVKAMDVVRIKQFVSAYKDHPALEGWHLADEPSINSTVGPLSPQNAITLYKAIKSVDPVDPVSITFASGEESRPYLPALDVLQHDDYPFKAWSREFTNLDRWKRFTFWMSYVARQNNKPFIPIMQAFGGSNLQPVMGYRAPTAREMRYMVYSSLAALSDSTYFWSFYRRDPAWVNSTLAPLVNDLRTMQPALTAGYRSGVVSSSNPNITATAVQNPTTLRWYIIAVNHTNANAYGSLNFSGELAGKDVAYRGGATTPISGNRLSHSLAQYEARVYTID